MKLEVKSINLSRNQNKALVSITCFEDIDGLGHDAVISVWVNKSDSIKQIEHDAILAAKDFISSI